MFGDYSGGYSFPFVLLVDGVGGRQGHQGPDHDELRQHGAQQRPGALFAHGVRRAEAPRHHGALLEVDHPGHDDLGCGVADVLSVPLKGRGEDRRKNGG